VQRLGAIPRAAGRANLRGGLEPADPAELIRLSFVERDLPGVQPIVEHHSGAAERPSHGSALARGWTQAIAVPELHIDIIFGFMLNIRDIALKT
jgi:hypothetical protein